MEALRRVPDGSLQARAGMDVLTRVRARRRRVAGGRAAVARLAALLLSPSLSLAVTFAGAACKVVEDDPHHSGAKVSGHRDGHDGDGDGDGDDGEDGHGGGAGKDVATFTVSGALPEQEEPFAFFGGGTDTLRTVIDRLDAASRDAGVGTVLVTIRPLALGWGRLMELRAALERARAAGKRTIAYVEAAGDREYVLASAASEVVMPPTGELMLVGLHVESIFLKELLAGFGVEADFEAVGRYKSAAETVTRTEPSPEAREAMTALVDDLYGAEVGAIAAGRGLAPEAVKAAIDAGPYLAADAVAAGLVTRAGYRAQVLDEALAAAGAGARAREDYGRHKRDVDTDNPLALLRLLLEPPVAPRTAGEPVVAVVYLTGPITHGGEDDGPDLFGTAGVRSGEALKTLAEVAKDPDVKAVVVRVDSPGGSAVASDLIYEALRGLGAKVPLVASMGDVAASGGYYVAMSARKIIAEPTTITGSIGVVGGKLVVGGLYKKYGVGSWSVSRGAHAGLMSDTHPFSDSERAALRKMMEGTYAAFVHKAAVSRGRKDEDVRAVAEGRVWSGAAAKDRGLVDALGGLKEALALARAEAKLPADAPVVVFPHPKGLADLFGGGAADAALSARAGVPPALAAAARAFLPGGPEALGALAPLLAGERVLLVAPFVAATR
jgi:protease-4